jgi:hypothetical protein
MQESPYLDGSGFLVDKLHQLSFLGALSDKYFKHILRLSKIRTFEDGEVITPEGAYDNWYVLFPTVGRNTARRFRIEDRRRLRRACRIGSARSASVEAIGPTVCLAIDASFMSETAEPLEQALFVSVMYRLFTEVIAQRLRAANEELVRVRSELDRLQKSRT